MKQLATTHIIPVVNPSFPCLATATQELGLRYTDSAFAAIFTKYYHLYFVTDEEPKDEDCVIYVNSVYRHRTANMYDIHTDKWACMPNQQANPRAYRKIVATTNPELWFNKAYAADYKHKDYGTHTGIAKIPESFIKAYISAYNVGNPIKQVMLEYELV